MLKTLFVLAALIATSMLFIPTASLAVSQVPAGATIVA